MIITLVQDDAVKKGELIIKYSELDKETTRAIAHLELINTKVKCSSEVSEVFVSVSDIFYFESVDKATFVYCEKEVYKTELRLYQIVEDFATAGFVQISKSCVLNVKVLDSIAPLINSRMEATLTNGERVHVTRGYLKGIKEALEGIRE